MTIVIEIVSAQIQNFFSIRSGMVVLNQPGLTVLEGTMSGAYGCSSNGAGKSSVVNAVIWALTGRVLQSDIAPDDVVRYGASESCHVSVVLRHGAKSVTVTRYRKHKKKGNTVRVVVDGDDVSRGTVAQTDLFLENFLGVDFQGLVNSVAFAARDDVRGFFLASDADRKRLFDRLLQLDVYTKALKQAKSERVRLAEELNDAEQSLEHLEQQDHRIQEALDDLQVLIQSSSDVDVRSLKVRMRYLAARKRNEEIKLQSLQDAFRIERQQYAEQKRVYDEALSAVRSAERERDREIVSCENELRQRTKRYSEAVRDLSEAKKSKSKCPLCGGAMKSEDYGELITAREKQVDEAGRLMTEAEMQLTVVKDAPVSSTVIVPPEPENDEVEYERDRVERQKDRIADLRVRCESARQEWKNAVQMLEKVAAQKDKLKTQAGSVLQDIEKTKERIATLQTQLSRVEFWVQGFGDKGLRSYLIESEVSRINTLVSRYASRLLHDGTTVKINTTTILKTSKEQRERISIEVNIPGAAQSYAAASKGQRRRLDLAMLLAFRDIVSSRAHAPIQQLFIDELFDGLDAVGVDAAIELLREFSVDAPVLLVTHDDRLRGVGDRVVTVVHNGEYATIDPGISDSNVTRAA